MKNKAFTLAETLITLTIIGVVAALTIPTLMRKYQEKQTVTGVKAAYSLLSNAIKLAETENGAVATWDVGVKDTPEGADKVAAIIFPHLKTVKTCKSNERGCFAEYYRNLQGSSFAWQPDSHRNYSRAQLENGMDVIAWSGGNNYINPIAFSVDINGHKPPNRAGYDYFIFNYNVNEGLKPAGRKEDMHGDYGSDCKYNGTSLSNGTYCTGWVMYKENMNYTRGEINWDE